jgi:hypothetical protein
MNAIPDVDWPKPIINNPRAAMDDISCRLERLKALFWSNTCDMQETLIDPGLMPPDQASIAHRIWMLFTTTGEKLEEIETLFAAVHEALLERGLGNEPVSSVGKHTRLRRSHEWASAVAALNIANSLEDPSDESFDAAGAAFEHMLETRVSTPAEFREKLTLIDATRHGIQSRDLDELFLDLDALGWRNSQAEV